MNPTYPDNIIEKIRVKSFEHALKILRGRFGSEVYAQGSLCHWSFIRNDKLIAEMWPVQNNKDEWWLGIYDRELPS